MIIESIDDWNDLQKTLVDFDYQVWQTQYDISAPEGYRVRFFSGKSVIDVETHSEEVYKAMQKFISPPTGRYRSRHIGE